MRRVSDVAKFDFSKNIKLLSDAMTCGTKDVPFIAQMHEFAMRESGIPGDIFYTDAKKFVQDTLEVTERFGFDTPSFVWDVYNVEAQALGCSFVTFEDMAPAIENVSPLVTCEADIAKLKAPDPYSSGRMPMVFEIMHEMKAQANMVPTPGFCAPFTLASHVMTFENLIVQMNENPQFVHKLMDFLVDEVIAPFMNALVREFPDIVTVEGSDAVASLPFITQDMLEEFSLQPLERLQKQVARPVFCDNWWGDSYARDLPEFWAQKRRATPSYLKVQDPDLFKLGVQPVIDYARTNDLPVVLGVDNNIFQSGTEDEIRMRIHEYMEAIEEVGKGALYLCSLSAVTPAQNVRIAIDACKDFRAGKRPWAGQRRAGTPEARGETANKSTGIKSSTLRAVTDEKGSPEELMLDDIFDAVMDADDVDTAALVKEALEKEVSVHAILNEALIAAMDEIGDDFADGTIFVPEMLMSARAMKAGLEVVRPILTATGEPVKGTVMLATVQGDVHDIGKNLVGMMLEGAGYEVIDLGVNKKPEEILERANEINPDVVGLSALLTTSMPSMQKTVDLFKKMNSEYPVIVGGAPVTEEFAEVIKADGYGENAPLAVEAVNKLIAEKKEANAAVLSRASA
jgi:5-methyltetrahydrofolate--homocysteine methyltransferase